MHTTVVWNSEQVFKSAFSSSTVWVQGTELSSSALVAGAFIPEAFFLPTKALLKGQTQCQIYILNSSFHAISSTIVIILD